MVIFWPDAVRNDKLLHVDVHEAGLLEPLLQLGPGTNLVAGPFKRAVDFIVISLERGPFETVVRRDGVAIPVLEFNPAAGFD